MTKKPGSPFIICPTPQNFPYNILSYITYNELKNSSNIATEITVQCIYRDTKIMLTNFI